MSYAHNKRNKRKARERQGFNAIETVPGQWEFCAGNFKVRSGSETEAYRAWRIVNELDHAA